MNIDIGQNNQRYGKVLFYIPEKGLRRKKGKLFGEGKYFFGGEEKHRRRKIFGEGKNICVRKIFGK